MTDMLITVHRGLSVTAILLTVLWVAVAAGAPRRPVRLGKFGRAVYIGAIASTGLAGLAGLLLLPAGNLTWALALTGLVAVAGHGVAGKRSRATLTRGQKRSAKLAALMQLALLVAAYVLMKEKPF